MQPFNVVIAYRIANVLKPEKTWLAVDVVSVFPFPKSQKYETMLSPAMMLLESLKETLSGEQPESVEATYIANV